jgi:hypothetical protein
MSTCRLKQSGIWHAGGVFSIFSAIVATEAGAKGEKLEAARAKSA